jgi:CRISP-associated protein Cas1
MQKGWFRMQDESTSTPEAEEHAQQPKLQGSWQPRGRDKKPRKRRSDASPPRDPADIVAEEEAREEAGWLKRGQHWQREADEKPRSPGAYRYRKVERKPLVLVGHGVRLRVHQGTLLVQNGFTHYPQKREELRLFPGDRRLPSRIIALDSDGSITLDVIKWLSEQHIPLVLLDWQGEVVSVVGDGAVYDPALREAQLAAQKSVMGLQIATELIRDKIANSRNTLRVLPPSPVVDTAADKLQAALEELHEMPPQSIDELLLTEANAANAYFAAWQMMPLRWKGTGRKPIPPEWHHVVARPSMVSGRNRHASHPVNAVLNYAYAVLESQVRIATVAQGLDPTIGYLHTCRPGRAALVYDLMEPLRPQVDRLVLSFLLSQTFSPGDFVLGANGVCRLHPQLIRRVVRLLLDDTVVSETATKPISELRTIIQRIAVDV